MYNSLITLGWELEIKLDDLEICPPTPYEIYTIKRVDANV